MGGSASPKPPPPQDMSGMYALLAQRGQSQAEAVKSQAEYLKMMAGMIPSVPTPDISGQNERILNQSIINAYQGRETEKLLDPVAAAMRQQLSPAIQQLTSPEAAAARQNQWLKTSGLQRVFGTGTGLSTFGASGLADAGTEEGFKNMLRNIQIRQGALGAAPSVGINPTSAASQPEAARQQQAAVANAFQQQMLQQGSGLINNAYQSGQSMSDAAMQLKMQELQNQNAYNQSVYQANLANRSTSPWANIFGGAASGFSSGLMAGGPMGGVGGALLGGGLGAAGSRW